MAVVDVTTLAQENGFAVFEWAAMATGDTVQPLQLGGSKPLAMAVQLRGTFGGAVALQGSNDGVTYTTLKDTAANAVSATGAAMFEITTSCRYLKPSIAASVTAVDMILCARG